MLLGTLQNRKNLLSYVGDENVVQKPRICQTRSEVLHKNQWCRGLKSQRSYFGLVVAKKELQNSVQQWLFRAHKFATTILSATFISGELTSSDVCWLRNDYSFFKLHAFERKPLAAKGQSRFVDVRNGIDERNFIFEYMFLKQRPPKNLGGTKKKRTVK